MFLVLEKKRHYLESGKLRADLTKFAYWMPSIAKENRKKKQTIERNLNKLVKAGYLTWILTKDGEYKIKFLIDFSSKKKYEKIKNRPAIVAQADNAQMTSSNVDSLENIATCTNKEIAVDDANVDPLPAKKQTTTTTPNVDTSANKAQSTNPEFEKWHKQILEVCPSFEYSGVKVSENDFVARAAQAIEKFLQDEHKIDRNAGGYMARIINKNWKPVVKPEPKKPVNHYEAMNTNKDEEQATVKEAQNFLDNMPIGKATALFENITNDPGVMQAECAIKSEFMEQFIVENGWRDTYIRNNAINFVLPHGLEERVQIISDEFCNKFIFTNS